MVHAYNCQKDYDSPATPSHKSASSASRHHSWVPQGHSLKVYEELCTVASLLWWVHTTVCISSCCYMLAGAQALQQVHKQEVAASRAARVQLQQSLEQKGSELATARGQLVQAQQERDVALKDQQAVQQQLQQAQERNEHLHQQVDKVGGRVTCLFIGLATDSEASAVAGYSAATAREVVGPRQMCNVPGKCNWLSPLYAKSLVCCAAVDCCMLCYSTPLSVHVACLQRI